MNQTFELLPEHIPLMADAFAPFGADARYIYDRATFDGKTPVTFLKGMIDENYRDNTAMYSHWKEEDGDRYILINVTSRKTGENIPFTTKNAHFQLNGKSTSYTPRPQISEAERQRREEKTRQAAQQNEQESEKKRRKFEQWNAAHIAAPKGGQCIETHPDVIKHFGKSAQLVANHAMSLSWNKASYRFENHAMSVTRITDNRGDCLSIGAVSEIDGEIEFYQRIYDRNIGLPDKPRNKDFCGAKKGRFHVIGNLAKGKYKGIYFVEGYMNGLMVHYATGCPVIVCFDAGNIAPVVKKFHDWGYQGLIIAPDNDIKPNKQNIGLFAAFKAVQGVTSAFIAPPYLHDGDNQIGCDFCDIFLAKGLQEVQRQLHKNSFLAFENGEMYLSKRISKDGRLKAEYESKFNEFMMQALPRKQTKTKREEIIANSVAKYPSGQGYGTPEEITEKLLKIFIHERDKEAHYNKIKIGCEIKHEAVRRRNSLTKADLHGVLEFDRANPADMAKLSELIKQNRATVIVDLPMGSNKTGDIAVVIDKDLDGKSSIIIVP
ncbi:MAG: hypothetical protein PHQ03_12980, partial [Methylococcales bacterium]|nr:hypothetical protein [Methylococcales bacterium]